MSGLFAFIIFLGPLVFVHELGHYLFAKLFNIKVEVFSIGFGPKLLKKKMGETEYCISAIPLGGYVKIFGEDPTMELTDEEKKRALNHQEKYKRFWVLFGGPLFNVLFTFFLFLFIFVIGEPQFTNRLGRVVEGSTGYEAGLRSGDRVLEVAGQKVEYFKDFIERVSEIKGDRALLKVEHLNGNVTSLNVPLKDISSSNPYGEKIQISTIEGVYPANRKSLIAVTDPKSIAGKTGLRTGDLVKEVKWGEVTTKIFSFEDFSSLIAEKLALKKKLPETIEIGVEKKGEPSSVIPHTLDLSFIRGSVFQSHVEFQDAIGIHSTELLIEEVIKGTPAAEVGVQAGDRVIMVNGVKPRSFDHLRSLVQMTAESGNKVSIVVERSGERQRLEMKPEGRASKDYLGNPVTTFAIGIRSQIKLNEGETVLVRILNPVRLVRESLGQTWDLIVMTVVTFKKLLLGEVSPKNLGGPLLIGKVASDSLDVGWLYFFKLMAMISINLAILNLLPVPVLDGGHLVFLGIEAVLGRPLSLKKMELAQQVGMTLLIVLMVFAFYNDISRMVDFKQIFN